MGSEMCIRDRFTLNPTWQEDEDESGGAGDEFDMSNYFKNWEQDRQSEHGDDDDDDVQKTNQDLQHLQV